MSRVLRNIVVALVVALTATSCFKKVTTDTTLRIKVLTEETSGVGSVPADGCYAYIYYTDKEDWTVASYEDAAAKIITHPESDEVRTEPNVESEPYVWEGSENNYLSLFQDKAPALLVVVYPEAKMYAYMYRKAEAENLPYTYLTLIFHTWKKESYYEGSKEGYRWTVVVPEVSETPANPDEPTTPENPDEPENPVDPDSPDNPDVK